MVRLFLSKGTKVLRDNIIVKIEIGWKIDRVAEQKLNCWKGCSGSLKMQFSTKGFCNPSEFLMKNQVGLMTFVSFRWQRRTDISVIFLKLRFSIGC